MILMDKEDDRYGLYTVYQTRTFDFDTQYFVGWILKKTPKVNDWLIPYLLVTFGTLLSILYIFTTERPSLQATFTAITQGILVAGASVLGNQLIKQAKNAKEEAHGKTSDTAKNH